MKTFLPLLFVLTFLLGCRTDDNKKKYVTASFSTDSSKLFNLNVNFKYAEFIKDKLSITVPNDLDINFSEDNIGGITGLSASALFKTDLLVLKAGIPIETLLGDVSITDKEYQTVLTFPDGTTIPGLSGISAWRVRINKITLYLKIDADFKTKDDPNKVATVLGIFYETPTVNQKFLVNISIDETPISGIDASLAGQFHFKGDIDVTKQGVGLFFILKSDAEKSLKDL